MVASAGKLRVLCVDDEPLVLEGLALHLRRRYQVVVASSGIEGLAAMGGDPFAVIVSDMRMPGMDGAEFLARARGAAPDSVRILLTGHADFHSALSAVNEGQIFRFLTKPCPPETMMAAVEAGAEQFRLVSAERVLLEQTLTGAVRALAETLAIANPFSFGRAVRLHRTASALCERLHVPDRWSIDVAAQLSQIGCIQLPPQVAEKLHYGKPLTADEQQLVDRIPAVADQVLATIPRLEPVREILSLQRRRFDGADEPFARPERRPLPLGARILRAAVDLDSLEATGLTPREALAAMEERAGIYDPDVLEALGDVLGAEGEEEVRELSLAQVRPGMVLATDVWSIGGVLLVARGHTVSDGLLGRLRNVTPGVREPVRVFGPAVRSAKAG